MRNIGNGIRGGGKRRSYTIPAGEISNKNPVTVATDTWISQELQVTVKSGTFKLIVTAI